MKNHKQDHNLKEAVEVMDSNKVQIKMPVVYTPPPPLKRWFPVLIPTIVVVNVILFTVTMYVNNCPELSIPPTSCFAPFLGRFSFQPIEQNYLLGPSYYPLIKMGALHMDKLVHIHQAWRLFTSMWLHHGVIDLLLNILLLLIIGIPLEKKFGFVRIGLVYVISGLGGNLLCVLFLHAIIYVGASGAIFGLLGVMLSEVLTNWKMRTHKFDKTLILVIIVIDLALGTFPFGNNFSNIGGFTSGFLLGFVILIRSQYNWLNLTKSNSAPKQVSYRYALCIISFVLLCVGFVVGLVLFLKGVDLNDYCSWCHYITCAPPSCKPGYVSCEDYQIGNKLNVTCLNNGRNGIFPLSNGNPYEQAEELCYRLCGK
ncbi:RHOMBOID-like protein 1 isoform X2 [Vicia villosa]|uniref:RHOMBOID-like protein 1 isoform X2 n=1 Tax=Vicia villosa TaxID=3911 RepID=UPI00273AB389|nr:RHOMBOID-like protein 1 isoform X2 [Vicia villosa]